MDQTIDRRDCCLLSRGGSWLCSGAGLHAFLRKAGRVVRKAIPLSVFFYTAGPQTAGACTWEAVASRYGVNAQVLYAIAHQESRHNPGAIHENADGSRDFGLMQINSRWLPYLNRFGITSAHLLDPCINLNVGAHLLAISMVRYGNTWQAIGAYHSATPSRRDHYAQSIHRHLTALGFIQKTPG